MQKEIRMDNKNVPLCAICGGSLDKELLCITIPDRFERFVNIQDKDYIRSWVECSACGAVSNVHLSANIAKLKSISSSYYEIDFQSSSIGEKYKKIMSLPREKSDNAQRVERIINFMEVWRREEIVGLSGSKRVLDIGAGTGVFLSRFLQKLSERGDSWVGVAVEPDDTACDHLRSIGAFGVFPGVYTDHPELRNFDLCTLNKIVEHIPEPVKFLTEVRRAAKKEGGVVYVEVPDKLTISYRKSSDNILGSLHYHLYDPKSLAILLELAGLIPIEIKRVFEPSGKISVIAFSTSIESIGSVAKVPAYE